MNIRAGRVISVILFSTGVALAFQNCATQKDHLNLSSSSSAQCRTQLKAKVMAEKRPATELKCGDFNNYSCERRLFSPDVDNLQHSIRECSVGGTACVDMDVRQFNTSGLREGAPREAFLPGGDYNHEEVHCYHHYLLKGLAVFEGSADNLEQALAQAMSTCENAQEVK